MDDGTMLRASADVSVGGGEQLLRHLCEHFSEHGEVEHANGRGRISTVYGNAFLELAPDGIHLVAEARDEVYLAYVKMGLAEHLIALAQGERPAIRWQGDGADPNQPPPFFREMRVEASQILTPRMRRVTLSGHDLARFAEGGHHVRLLFPPKERAPVWPRLGEDGRIAWPQGEDALQARVYTIRHIDPPAGRVVIDIVLHDGDETPGSRFALTAKPGDIVGMTGPGGSHVPDASALILVGDETALPAIARILETLPDTGRARVLVEVDGPEDEVPLLSKGQVEATFLHRGGRPSGTCGLLPEALRAVDLESLGEKPFVWAGCEFADFCAIRAYLRKECRMAKDDHLVVAYWRRGEVGH